MFSRAMTASAYQGIVLTRRGNVVRYDGGSEAATDDVRFAGVAFIRAPQSLKNKAQSRGLG